MCSHTDAPSGSLQCQNNFWIWNTRDAEPKGDGSSVAWQSTDKSSKWRLKQQITKLMHQAKTEYYSAKICASATCKDLFLNVNTFLGKAKPSTFPATYTEELPGVFRFLPEQDHRYSQEPWPRCFVTLISWAGRIFSGCPLVELRPVSREFVHDLLKRTPLKSCELDSIPTALMYECMDILLPLLMQISMSHWQLVFFAPTSKMAIVKPQLKKQNLDPNNLKNYRPISNLPFLSRLLEKTVLINFKITWNRTTSTALFNQHTGQDMV